MVGVTEPDYIEGLVVIGVVFFSFFNPTDQARLANQFSPQMRGVCFVLGPLPFSRILFLIFRLICPDFGPPVVFSLVRIVVILI
jgi:hypothetical protein